MSMYSERFIVIVSVGGLFSFSILNRLYRASSRAGLSMFSIDAIRAGWPYWVGLVFGLLVCICYLVFTKRQE